MFYWIPKDREAKFRAAVTAIHETFADVCNIYSADMNISIGKNLHFAIDEKFMQSFRSTAENDQEKSLVWRLHTLAWATTHALNIPGDFVECGVLRGFCSEVLCKYLDFATVPKQYYLYDTFSGLPEETSSESERNAWNKFYSTDAEAQLQHVRAVFAPYPNVKIIPGVVPNTFAQASPDTISYLHLDMNSIKAEELALEALFDRISPGGLIVLDDFGWVCNQGQAVSQIAFMKQRGYSILELPTGQGLVVKR